MKILKEIELNISLDFDKSSNIVKQNIESIPKETRKIICSPLVYILLKLENCKIEFEMDKMSRTNFIRCLGE